MANLFNITPVKNYKRSKFNLSNFRLTTTEAGRLTPIRCQEVMPGDTFKLRNNVFVRLAPMVAPILQPVDVRTDTLFVPSRLLCDKWEEFLTGDVDGDYNELLPYVTLRDIALWYRYMTRSSQEEIVIKAFKVGSLADYLLIPTFDKQGYSDADIISAFDSLLSFADEDLTPIQIYPFLANKLVYFEYYINENIQDFKKYRNILKTFKGLMGHISFGTTTTPNTYGNFTADELFEFLFSIEFKNWKKDYYTSALPFAQRGPATNIPLSGSAPLSGQVTKYTSLRDVLSGEQDAIINTSGGNSHLGTADSNGDYVDLVGQVEGSVDLSNASAVTINELRTLFTIQRYKELLARGGARLKEMILHLYGEKVADYRLQRPEYLGGGVQPVSVSEVLQMSSSTEDSPQGNMAGHGVSVGAGHGIVKRYRFTEHGYIIELLSIMPKPMYMNGLPKMFSRFERLDLPVPIFSNLGEMPIKNKEIYFSGIKEQDDGDFGYQSQYADMKFMNNEVTGQFATTLNFWHMARMFRSLPRLNAEFISSEGNVTTRPFAVTDQPNMDHYWILIETNNPIKRKLSKFGIPR